MMTLTAEFKSETVTYIISPELERYIL